MAEVLKALWSVTGATEFWSAITGALVGAVAGGLIALMVQVKALREGRRQRDEAHKLTQETLGNALIFKMMRIHSNFYGVHLHIEGCLAEAEKKGLKGEPWQFVMPLVNPPDPVRFSSDEMGMLLSLKNVDVFNSVLPMDFMHNGLIAAVNVLNAERKALTERLKPDEAKGVVLSGNLTRDQALTLRPRMIEVNSLVEGIRSDAKRGFEESDQTLSGLHKLLQDKLGVTYKLKSTVKPNDPQASEGSGSLSTPSG